MLRDLGLLDAGRGDYPAAADRYRAALVLLERSGPVQTIVSVRLDLSQVLAAMGSLDHADRELRAAEQQVRKEGLGPSIDGRIQLARGDLAVEFNRVSSARERYEAGSTLLRKAKDRAGKPTRSPPSAQSASRRRTSPPREACSHPQPHLQQSVESGRSAASTALLTARAARELGDTADSAISWRRRSTRCIGGDRVAEAWARCESGNLERAIGTQRAAEASYRIGLERLGRAPAADVAACLVRRPRPDASCARRGSSGRHGARARHYRDRGRGHRRGRARPTGRLPERQVGPLCSMLGAGPAVTRRGSAGFETSERLRAQQTLMLIAAARRRQRPPRRRPASPPSGGASPELMDVSAAGETAVALRGPVALIACPTRDVPSWLGLRPQRGAARLSTSTARGGPAVARPCPGMASDRRAPVRRPGSWSSTS